MITKFFIDFREWFIHVFKKKILLIEKDKEFVSNKLVIIPLNFFYFFLLKDMLKDKKINIIYKLDDIIFYDDNIKHNIFINKILLECYITDNKCENYKMEFLETINKYSKNVPFYIIIKLENLNINFDINLKLLNFGSFIDKKYPINEIINKRIYEIIN
jgi:hypothetical protein